MAQGTNLQNVDSFKLLEAASIDFAYRFGEDMSDFMELLGIYRKLPVTDGHTIKFYTEWTADLADGNVGEGELIPLSKGVPAGKPTTKEVTLKKYRRETTLEAINKFGFSGAVNQADKAIYNAILAGIRNEFFGLLKTAGTNQVNLNPEHGLQGALASAWGALQTIFEQDSVETVAFVNPMDVAQATADKVVTLDQSFGLTYYTTVTGTRVVISPKIEQGTIYATTPDNLIMAYIPTTSEGFSHFDMRTDSTGLLGVTHNQTKNRLTSEVIAVYGLLLFPERVDGVVKVEIAGQPSQSNPASQSIPAA